MTRVSEDEVTSRRGQWRQWISAGIVIAWAASVPLAVGSVRQRAHGETTGRVGARDVRAITLEPAADDAPPLDARMVRAIERAHPGVEVIGDLHLLARVVGPKGADVLTLRTLGRGDPRLPALRLDPELTADFGPRDLVVSDALGRTLYGDAWPSLWRSGRFTGESLVLALDEGSLLSDFRIVTRQRAPGRALYANRDWVRATTSFRAPDRGSGARPGDRWDELVIFVPEVEEVEGTARELRRRYPRLEVWFDSVSVARLTRWNAWLSALFGVTLALASLVVWAALAGFGRLETPRDGEPAERRIPLLENLAVGALATLAAGGLASVLCAYAKRLLARALDEGAGAAAYTEPLHGVVIETLAVHPAAFAQVGVVVAICAGAAAFRWWDRGGRSEDEAPPGAHDSMV